MKTVFKKGDIIEFEDGEYSDHTVWAPMRALKPFNLRNLASEYVSLNPEIVNDYSLSFTDFVGWMNNLGYIEDCKPGFIHRVWLGGYAIFNEKLFK